MSDTVTMPKLGFDMQEGTLVRWVKSEGETVSKGEVLAEIETDKATVEVESSYSGVVARHLVAKGDIVPVGTPIAIIAAPGEKVEEVAPAKAASKPAEKAPEKPTSDQPAAAPVAEAAAVEEGGDGRIKASPLARRVAREQGVDLNAVKGSGPGGRIIRSDVEAAAQAVKAAPAPAAAIPVAPAIPIAPAPAAPAAKPAAAVPPVPVWTGAAAAPADESIKMNRLRQAIGRRMVESKQQVPHFYVSHSYKMEKVMELRAQINSYLPDNQKLTVNDFVLKAAALALRELPNLNSSVKGDEIIRHGHINMGVAVAVEGGLLTIVVKDADQKPLRLISSEVREMAGRVRSGKVKTEDIEGSTFSTSNLGMFDVEEFVAIINPPETAILAIASAKQVPVVEDGQLKVGTRMTATISADHRVTDGVEAARFMQALAMYLEEPMRLML